LSKEYIQKIFINLGFNKTEIKIYFYLLKEGEKKARDIGKVMKLYKQQLYRSLKKMEKRNIIRSVGHPAHFSAVSFDNILDFVIKANLEEAKHIIQKKERLLSGWRSLKEKDFSGI